MFTSLSRGDKFTVGDSVTLTVLAIEGDLIRFGIESSESGGPDPQVLVEEGSEPDERW